MQDGPPPCVSFRALRPSPAGLQGVGPALLQELPQGPRLCLPQEEDRKVKLRLLGQGLTPLHLQNRESQFFWVQDKCGPERGRGESERAQGSRKKVVARSIRDLCAKELRVAPLYLPPLAFPSYPPPPRHVHTPLASLPLEVSALRSRVQGKARWCPLPGDSCTHFADRGPPFLSVCLVLLSSPEPRAFPVHLSPFILPFPSKPHQSHWGTLWNRDPVAIIIIISVQCSPCGSSEAGPTLPHHSVPLSLSVGGISHPDVAHL